MRYDPRRFRSDALWNGLVVLTVTAAVVGLLVALLPAAPRWWAAAACALTGAWFWWRSLRRWRRRRRLRGTELTDEQRRILEEEVDFYGRLQEDERRRFREMIRVFLAEVPVVHVGCEGDERDRLLVAASAVIPVFGFPAWEYGDLRRVLVRPHHFDPDFAEQEDADVRAAGMVSVHGLLDGIVVLSQEDLRRGFDAEDGRNVGLHEFAHLVDLASGAVDGLPPAAAELRRAWYRESREELASGARPSAPLRPYGYTDEAEFFAVASERFFEEPRRLRRDEPELYRLLADIFHQDLAARARRRLRRRR